MILNGIYEEFLAHTNLTDGTYKAVFQRLSELIDKVNAVKWKRITYVFGKQVYDVNFEERNAIPVYMIELLRNVMEHNYSFPEDSMTTISLEYNGTIYEIIAHGNLIQIPDEVSFLRLYKTFSLYYLSDPVVNAFNEFDNFFHFFENFKSKPMAVFDALRKQFDGNFLDISNDEVQYEENTYLTDTAIVEGLMAKRTELVELGASLEKEKTALLAKKNELSQGLTSKGPMQNDKDRLMTEYKLVKDSYDKEQENEVELTAIVKDLHSEIEILLYQVDTISDPSERDQVKQNLEIYKDKKAMFVAELDTVRRNMSDNAKLLSEIQNQLGTVNGVLSKVDNCSVDTLKNIDTDLYNIEKKSQNVYDELVYIDNDIRVKQEAIKASFKKSGAAADMQNVNLQMIEKRAIVDHLNKNLKPAPVIVVENYLRYYFAYHVDKLFGLIKDEVAFPKEWTMAIVCRQILEKYFGVHPHTFFSTVLFNPKSVKNFISVHKG